MFLPNEKFAEWCSAYHSRMIAVNEDWEQPVGNEIVDFWMIGDDCSVCDQDGVCSFDPDKKPNPYFFDDELEYVYDITTETGRFVANGMVQHNCFAINASKLVMEGRPFGSLPSAPPHRISSYIACLNEQIHQMSNSLAGAIAVSSYFFDACHLLFYREHKTLTDLKDPVYRKYVENAFQSFVHSMSHLSRQGGIESPFTNLSIFDRNKILALIDDDNMGWYFQKEDAEDGIPEEALKDCGDRDWKEYIVLTIKELQDIFMNIMDNGDPLHDHRVIEFPVVTFNISRRQKEDGTYEFEDPEWVEHFCNNHDIYRYNIYISEGMKVASCHDFNDLLYYEDEEGKQLVEPIGEFVTRHLSNGETEVDIVEKLYVRGSNNERIPISGAFKIPNTSGKLIEFDFDNGQVLRITPDHKFRVTNSQGEIKVITAEEISQNRSEYIFNEKGLKLREVNIIESNAPVYDIEINSEDHLYVIGDVVNHNCCRLINNSELFDLGGQVNSFGGTALSLGSHRVCTVNLRRISLECNSWEDYKERLVKRMDDTSKVLRAHKALLKDLVARGTQPFLSNGWLDLDRMFSTFGLMGYYEANEDLKKKFGGEDYLPEIIQLIEKTAREFTERDDNVYNCEEIPGESMSSRLAKADHWIFDGLDPEWD